MKVERLEKNLKSHKNSIVRVKRMGNITEVRYMVREPRTIIKKLDKYSFVDMTTGEIKDFKTSEKRIENLESVSRSLRNLRDIINTNIADTKKCLWVTLTYKENITDTKLLYDDYRKFNMRFQRYLQKNNLQNCEYIACAEPQGRGAWHLHILYIFPFPTKTPYIENSILAKLWGKGFVHITSLKGIDNIGVYLTSYLCNLDVSKFFDMVSSTDENQKKKAIVKGARLTFYPTGFRIYRCSKGIKKPIVCKMTEYEAMQELKGQTLTFEKTIKLTEDEKLINVINYRHYNKKANSKISCSKLD